MQARLLVRALSLLVIVYLIVYLPLYPLVYLIVRLFVHLLVYPIIYLRLVSGVHRHSVMAPIMAVYLRLVPGARYRYSVVACLVLHSSGSRTFVAHNLV